MKALHALGAGVIAVSRTNTDLVSLSKEVGHAALLWPKPAPHTLWVPHEPAGSTSLITDQCLSTVPRDRDRVCGLG